MNPRLKQSRKEVVHERENSITIKIPPMGVTVFSCMPEKTESEGITKEKTESGLKEAKSEIQSKNKKQRQKDQKVRTGDTVPMSPEVAVTNEIKKEVKKRSSKLVNKEQIEANQLPSDDAKGETTKKS